MSEPRASQFYTGLVAELYEPLLGSPSDPDDYVPFLERAGTPALELGCGSGLPLVELVARGYAVEGLDASADMLERCRRRAARAGVDVVLHEGEMETMSLGRSYRSIFLAGATFTLLPSDESAERALERMCAHLEPGGSALVPLEIPDPERIRASLGKPREVETGAGETLRVQVVDASLDPERRTYRLCLRYERTGGDGQTESLERDWRRMWWSPAHFVRMMKRAGFSEARALARDGSPASPEADFFVVLGRR